MSDHFSIILVGGLVQNVINFLGAGYPGVNALPNQINSERISFENSEGDIFRVLLRSCKADSGPSFDALVHLNHPDILLIATNDDEVLKHHDDIMPPKIRLGDDDREYLAAFEKMLVILTDQPQKIVRILYGNQLARNLELVHSKWEY